MLATLARQIRFDNASQGFDPTEGGVERYYLLAISEICEAQNELRDGRDLTEVYYSDNKKPEGFPVEIADAMIRILDIQAKLELKIQLMSLPPWDRRDKSVTLDKELLAVVEKIALCYRKYADVEENLNLALSALFVICENLDIPIMDVIKEKLAFNKTRPPKHGRKF